MKMPNLKSFLKRNANFIKKDNNMSKFLKITNFSNNKC